MTTREDWHEAALVVDDLLMDHEPQSHAEEVWNLAIRQAASAIRRKAVDFPWRDVSAPAAADVSEGLAYIATQCPVEARLSPNDTATFYCQHRVGHDGPHLIGATP